MHRFLRSAAFAAALFAAAPALAQTVVSGKVDANVKSLATGGATPFHLISAATTNSTLISAGLHTLYTLNVTGLVATTGVLKVFDLATAPASCGATATPVHSFPVIGSTTVLGGQNYPLPAQGEAYLNGLAICFVGAVADNDNSVGPAGFAINVTYK
jgi:hypothetical protein